MYSQSVCLPTDAAAAAAAGDDVDAAGAHRRKKHPRMRPNVARGIPIDHTQFGGEVTVYSLHHDVIQGQLGPCTASV